MVGRDYDEEKVRLSSLLQPTEHLKQLCPAVHRSRDGSQRRLVWLGLAKSRCRDDRTVFIFARTHWRCLRNVREWVYCVLPVVANIAIDIDLDAKCCVFTWSPKAHRMRRRRLQGPSDHLGDDPRFGDLHIVDVDDRCGLLDRLKIAVDQASEMNLLFPPGKGVNHKELWAYKDAIPSELPSMKPRVLRNDEVHGSVVHATTSEEAHHNNLHLLVFSWNVGATEPKCHSLMSQLLRHEEPEADIVCVGMQEVCALTAKTVMVDGVEWMAWKEWVEGAVAEAYQADLELLKDVHLVGMLLLIFVRRSLRPVITEVLSCLVPTGVGGLSGNKGAVCIRMEISDVSICFINAHLAAGQENYIQRCMDYQTIAEGIRFTTATESEEPLTINPSDGEASSSSEGGKANERSKPLIATIKSGLAQPMKLVAGGVKAPTSMVEMSRWDGVRRSMAGPATTFAMEYSMNDHDHVIFLGDTNSRLHWPDKVGGMPLRQAARCVEEQRMGELLTLDQLNLMRRDGLAFDGFEELPIVFLPSYKWKPGDDCLDIRSQKHIPAWTDRILWRSGHDPSISGVSYDLVPELRQSDHRPVMARLRVPLGKSRSNSDGSIASFRDGLRRLLTLGGRMRLSTGNAGRVRLSTRGSVKGVSAAFPPSRTTGVSRGPWPQDNWPGQATMSSTPSSS